MITAKQARHIYEKALKTLMDKAAKNLAEEKLKYETELKTKKIERLKQIYAAIERTASSGSSNCIFIPQNYDDPKMGTEQALIDEGYRIRMGWDYGDPYTGDSYGYYISW